jgi:hypothetical protein
MEKILHDRGSLLLGDRPCQNLSKLPQRQRSSRTVPMQQMPDNTSNTSDNSQRQVVDRQNCQRLPSARCHQVMAWRLRNRGNSTPQVCNDHRHQSVLI